MAVVRQNLVVPPEDDYRDRLFPHYKVTSSYQSGSSRGHEESERIMSVLRDWTEANQKYGPHQGSRSSGPQVKVDRVGTQAMLNQDIFPGSPRCERRMTPDLIRVSPQQQMNYHGENVPTPRGPEMFMTRPLSVEVSKPTLVDSEIYQQSMSDDYQLQRTFETDQSSESSMQGLSFSNPTYSRVNSPTPSEGGDFYSKENIRSLSQMLLLSSPEAASTPSQNNSSEHCLQDRSFSIALPTSTWKNKNSSWHSTRGNHSSDSLHLENNFIESHHVSNHNSHTKVANQVYSVAIKSSYPHSENTSVPNFKQTSPKVSENYLLNDSLLSSPKFKALRIANSSDSTQSSPQISRKSTTIPFKSSFNTDRESKNSLDSSTLSIATSWSSGLGIPFPQSHSSTSLSTPSPAQKIHSSGMENFRKQSSSTMAEDSERNTDDMFPWLVSNVPKPKENLSKRVTQSLHFPGSFNSEGKLDIEIKNSISSVPSRSRHGYQSGTIKGGSFIHPPQYPSIPRAKTKEVTESNLASKGLRKPDYKKQFPQHSCCNCSCHEVAVPSRRANGIEAPFPLLLYDQNENIIDLSCTGGKGNSSGSMQTLHPVNRIHSNSYSEDYREGREKGGDSYPMKGTQISDKYEDKLECKGHLSHVFTQPKCLTSHPVSTSIPQGTQRCNDHHNTVPASTVGLGFQVSGNPNIDLFPTIADDNTLKSDQVSFGRKTWSTEENASVSEFCPAYKQFQQKGLLDKSSHCTTTTNSEMRIVLRNSSSSSHEISPSPRSPPESPNRIPPPVPKRDLSITISNKTKRSPLALPPYTSDLCLHDVSPRNGEYSHDPRWWAKIDEDLNSPRKEVWKEIQGMINGEISQVSQKDSQSDSWFQGREHASDRNGINFQQDNERWGDQEAEDMDVSWREVTEMGSNNTGTESNVNESLDSFSGTNSMEFTTGLTEYENVALIDVDKITGVSGQYSSHITERLANGQHKSQGELGPSQSDKMKGTTISGNVKSIVSKFESRSIKIKQWDHDEYGCRQNHTFPGACYQYSEGSNLSMLPPPHFASDVPQEHSSCYAPSHRTMQSFIESPISLSKHSESNSQKDSVASHKGPVVPSSESWNGSLVSSNKHGYHSSHVEGSWYGRDSIHPERIYHQPDVIPKTAPITRGETNSSMGSKVCPSQYAWDRSAIRAPPLGVKSPMQRWVESSVLQLNLTESNSVQQWLFDIRFNTDCESMCVLQGKSIHTSPVNLEMTANTIKENVLRLKTASKCLSAKFAQLHGKLSERSEDIAESCSVICKEIYSMVKECEGFFLEIPSNLFSQQQSLMQETSQFKRLIKEFESDVHGELHPEGHLTEQLLELGQQCAVFVETVQTKLIQALVYSVQDSASELNIMVSVKTVHSLITDYPSIKPILLQEQVISALFQVCLQTSFAVTSVQLLSLQTIARFCQDSEGRIETEKVSMLLLITANQFMVKYIQNSSCSLSHPCVFRMLIEKEIGGIGHLSQIISSPTSSESLKIEAAALISQLTAPEVVSDFRQSRFHQHLEVLLRALTDLMEQSKDPLVFLVASSAVANITFMGSMVFEFLAQDYAARIIVEGWKNGKMESLNIKDQVVTIFANMAEDQACRESIKQFEGIPMLIELLQNQIPGVENEDETKANDDVIRDAKICEQIQQKSAIALARLSKDKKCAAEIEQLEGISIFSRICRTSSYRNKSVPVLIACLAALRRLHHALGPSSFHQDDIDILVRPKMIESIFSCSSLSEESFV